MDNRCRRYEIRWGFLILLLALLVALPGACAWAYYTDPDIAIREITSDGRSYARRGLGFAPKGNLLAYYREDADKAQIIVRTLDGKQEWVASRLGIPYQSAWSPDGKRIAYLLSETSDDNSAASLYIWSAASGTAVEIAGDFKYRQFKATGNNFGAGYSFVWAPDSRHFTTMIRKGSDPNNSVQNAWVFDAEGGPGVQLAPNHLSTYGWYAPTWSPDSQWVVFGSMTSPSSGMGIWKCRRDGTELKELVPPSSAEAYLIEPLWSPDGKWIAYLGGADRLRDEQWMNDVWLMRPDGSDNHAITHGSRPGNEGRQNFMSHRWSPDSQRLSVWYDHWDAQGAIHNATCVVDIATKELAPIIVGTRESSIVHARYRHTLEWDHTGRRLCLTPRVYERHGEEQLADRRDYLGVYDTQTKTLMKLIEVRPPDDAHKVAADYLWMPTWSPDGTKILFTMGKVISLTEDTAEPDLYVAELVAAPVVSAVEPPVVSMVEPPVAGPVAASLTAAGGTTLVIPQQRRATEIAEALPGKYAGIYQVDKGLNALVVSTPDEGVLAAFQRDVTLLDQPVAQIMVDVLVTELSHDASRQLGLDWEHARGHWGATLPMVFGDAGQVIYQGVGTLDKEFFGTLSALAENGEANVRSNPRVLARCGSQATINIRRTDNFLFEAGMDSYGRPVRSRSDISADIILKITPQFLASQRIALAVDATVDSFIFGAANDLPDTTRRQAVTDVVCGDGETIIIGGLTQTEQTRKVQKTPLLGDLPLIGSLFRHTTRSQRDTTLVIFITPRMNGQVD